MTKFILLSLIFSLSSFAQTDELTLESTTAPTVVEDDSDLSLLSSEEPQDAPDTVDITENVPAQIPVTTPVEEVPIETPKAIVEQTPPPAVSTPVITTEIPKDDRYIDHRKSHWITTFGFEGLKYELPFEFRGVKRNFKDREQELYGARVGVGGQLYLGAGFFTTSKVEGFYNGTLFTKIQNAGPEDDDEDVSQIKRTGGIYGAEISQQLGVIIEFRTKNPFMDEWAYLTFEPFVEAGLGVASAYNSVSYFYDSAGVIDEGYRQRISDKLTNAKVGAGFNLTGRSGFFMYARATVNRFDITERKIRTYAKQDQQAATTNNQTVKDAKIEPITMFAVGGGYKF